MVGSYESQLKGIHGDESQLSCGKQFIMEWDQEKSNIEIPLCVELLGVHIQERRHCLQAYLCLFITLSTPL